MRHLLINLKRNAYLKMLSGVFKGIKIYIAYVVIGLVEIDP